MLAIIIFLSILPALFSAPDPFFVQGNIITSPARRAPASPATIVAADGQLLTVPDESPTILTPPSAPRSPGSGETNAAVPLPHVAAAAAGDAPPADPLITPAPGTTEEMDWDGVDVRFKQTTYWSCVTRGTYSHCGWHEPILDASAVSDIRGGRTKAFWAAVASAVVLGVWLGI